MKDYISEVFGDGGLFASRFPGYEMREGQVALARMVDEAMSGGRHALGEGPCGTGKSVAYCVPAIHHAHHEKRRVVIATANIALQEQLVRKDLPMLASVLPWPFTFALLKGRNNYLCLDRMVESEARGELRGLYFDDQQRQVDEVLAWADATKTGDVSELAFIPHAQVWSKFSVGSEDCKGDGCPFRDDCFAERAKATAQGADIVVTNYHMLFAHLAVREATGQDLVLPAFDLLVLDEAHEAAEIAREFFGFTLSEHTFGRLASAAADLGNKQLAGELRQEAQRLFGTLADYRPLAPVQEAAQGAGLRQRLGPTARARQARDARQSPRRGRARGQEGARHGAQRGQERRHRDRASVRGALAVESRLRLLARRRQQGAHQAPVQAHRRERAAAR
jgi:ATP-dependent DNA helicase DinG